LQDSERRLQQDDEKLIPQGDEVLRQGTKIFGPAAESSWEVLEHQGIAIRSPYTETYESMFSADDIRIDQSSEARRYLSKKGDVDLLKESLSELQEEMIIASEDATSQQADLEYFEHLESRQRELESQLEQAEQELSELRDSLPDRKVDIHPEQLRSSDEGEEYPTGIELIQQPSPPSPPISLDQGRDTRLLEDERGGLRQILASVTDDGPDRSNALVTAYLAQLSPPDEEQLSPPAEEQLSPPAEEQQSPPAEEQQSPPAEEQQSHSEGLQEATHDTHPPGPIETDPELSLVPHTSNSAPENDENKPNELTLFETGDHAR